MADYGTYYQGMRQDIQNLNKLSDLFGDKAVAGREADRFALEQQRKAQQEQQIANQAWQQSGGNLDAYNQQMAKVNPEFAAQYQGQQTALQKQQEADKAAKEKQLHQMIAMGGGTMQAVQSAAQRARMLGFGDEDVAKAMQYYGSMPDDVSRANSASAMIADYDKWYQQQVEIAKAGMQKPVDPLQQDLLRAQAEKYRAEADKARRPEGAKEQKPIYDTASNEWVYPPSAEFPQGRRTGDVGKMNAVTAAKDLMTEMIGTKDKPGVIYQTKTGGTLGLAGQLSRITDTQKVKEFNNMKEALSAQMRAVLRIPGEGALSDKEQAQYGLQLPDITNDPAVNEGIIRRLAKTLETRGSSTYVAPSATSGGARFLGFE